MKFPLMGMAYVQFILHQLDGKQNMGLMNRHDPPWSKALLFFLCIFVVSKPGEEKKQIPIPTGSMRSK